ncbi:MAG: hypothetical protein WAM53_09215 [Terrimicrobiaceae bacterium]
MKHLQLAIAALSLVCSWTCGIAQPADEGDPAEPPPPIPREERRPRERGPGKFLESLPPEARDRFEAARAKALQDPKLQELRKNAETANRTFFKAMREKMLEIDPGLAEIVRKQAIERKAWKAWKEEGDVPGFGSLGDGEREKLKSAMEKTGGDPAVQAAEKAKREANTPEERDAASREYRKALHEALLKVDPSVAPILDKLSSKRPPPPKPEGTEGNDLTAKDPQ